jgi:hypothetical protein
MANNEVIQELNDLESSLGKIALANAYSVPEGYFEGLAEQVIDFIKSHESIAWLSSFPRSTPYQLPGRYFDGLEERIMEFVRNHPDYQTSQEELEIISPLLNTLNKRPVYAVPEGYFENFNFASKQKAKLIPIASRKWLRYAAAAMITGVIALAGVMIYNNNHKDAAGTTLAKFEKDVKQIDDVRKTDSLIDFMDAGLNQKQLASNQSTTKIDDVQNLLKDVSTDELKDFSDQSKDIEDVMMTN